MSMFISAQEQAGIESDSYVYDNVVVLASDLQAVRNVRGGTKIIIEYEGAWPTDIKGAFEYACKIWEEVMPTTYPIHIKAVFDETTVNRGNAYSKVQPMVRNHEANKDVVERFYATNVSTLLQMKGTHFFEASSVYDTHVFDSVLTADMFNQTDMRLTYYNHNNQIVNNCSFSLEGISDSSRYDFVTMVLRDIAKGFGLFWDYTNPSLWEARLDEKRVTPYGNAILKALGYYKDKSQMVAAATQGHLNISNYSETWSLYAPINWDTSRSLNSFIPEASKKLSQLLGHDVSRGTVIRDINDNATYNIFEDLLLWRGDYATGSNISSLSLSTSTEDVKPYNSLNISSTNNSTVKKSISQANKNTTEENWQELTKKYHPFYVPGEELFANGGVTVSFLLNDGTWDVVNVWSDPTFLMDIDEEEVLNEAKTFHYPITDYARSCDGYLRCRLSTYKRYSAFFRRLTHKYILYDYLPQKPVMAKSARVRADLGLIEDEYYKDVKIDIKNLEGITRVVVAQYDGENAFPYYYEVPDFKNGYFITTIDKEVSTKFIITAYNVNGSTLSDTYVLPPSTDVISLGFCMSNGRIIISAGNDVDVAGMISDIKIDKISVSGVNNKATSDITIRNNSIDVSNLTSGLYVLTIIDTKGHIFNYKFTIK